MDISKLTRQGRKLLKLKYCGAVIVAAGSASRMGGIDKVMAELGGEPMIKRTVRTFQECDAIQEIVVVTRPDLILPVMDLCAEFNKVKAVVAGGSSRDESVGMGLNTLSKQVKLVAVQDGARPLVTWQLVDRVVRAANSYGAAAPAVPVKDTIKVVQGGIVAATPDRETLKAVQTPQVFDKELISCAYQKLLANEEKLASAGVTVTDDAMVVEYFMNTPVKLVQGSYENMKITTPEDLEIAEIFLGRN